MEKESKEEIEKKRREVERYIREKYGVSVDEFMSGLWGGDLIDKIAEETDEVADVVVPDVEKVLEVFPEYNAKTEFLIIFVSVIALAVTALFIAFNY